MVNFSDLKIEVVTDPISLGYASKSDQEIADLLNEVLSTLEVGRKRDREEVASWEILEQTELSELKNLPPEKLTRYYAILAMGIINVQATNIRTIMLDLFAAGTTTRSNLAAFQTFSISRANFLGLPVIKPGDVEEAKAI